MYMVGIMLSFVTLFGWGFSDFIAQRSTRSFGIFASLFFACSASIPVLLPFVYQELWHLSTYQLLLLSLRSAVTLLYAITLFRAFRVGKLTIVETIISLELPITVGIAVAFLGEHLTWMSFALMCAVIVGILFASAKRTEHLLLHRYAFERGAKIALLAAFLAALTNILVGVSAQATSPLLTVWFSNVVLSIASLGMLAWHGELSTIIRDVYRRPGLIAALASLDTLASVCYAFATTLIPISLVITISEAYIILASGLGHFWGHEPLKAHQVAGVLIALPCVVLLAAL